MRLIIVTGLSGSGKSVAIRQLEDIGYYCIDNFRRALHTFSAMVSPEEEEYLRCSF